MKRTVRELYKRLFVLFVFRFVVVLVVGGGGGGVIMLMVAR